MKKKAAVLLTAAVLTGCAGPSAKVLPQRQSGTMQEVPDEVPVVEEVNSFYLQESLGILSASPRPSGSRGEDNAARYIQKLLKDYGYTVNRQRFREKSEHEEVLGTNVVAMRPAEDPDADIILICTWHDSARKVREPETMRPAFPYFWKRPGSCREFPRTRRSVSSVCRPTKRMPWVPGFTRRASASGNGSA